MVTQPPKKERSDPGSEPVGRLIVSAVRWFWAVLLAGVILATFFPILGRRIQIRHGERCCENLDRIFRAKEALVRDLDLYPSKPYPPIVHQLKPMDLYPYLKNGQDLSCPDGGVYRIRPLVDSNGEVVPPVCDKEGADPDGNGVVNRGEGLHIHRPSHLQDPETGEWFREPAFVFPK